MAGARHAGPEGLAALQVAAAALAPPPAAARWHGRRIPRQPEHRQGIGRRNRFRAGGNRSRPPRHRHPVRNAAHRCASGIPARQGRLAAGSHRFPAGEHSRPPADELPAGQRARPGAGRLAPPVRAAGRLWLAGPVRLPERVLAHCRADARACCQGTRVVPEGRQCIPRKGIRGGTGRPCRGQQGGWCRHRHACWPAPHPLGLRNAARTAGAADHRWRAAGGLSGAAGQGRCRRDHRLRRSGRGRASPPTGRSAALCSRHERGPEIAGARREEERQPGTGLQRIAGQRWQVRPAGRAAGPGRHHPQLPAGWPAPG